MLARPQPVVFCSPMDPWVTFAFSSLAAATLLGVILVRRSGRSGGGSLLTPNLTPGVPGADVLAAMAGDLAAVRAEWAAWRKQVEAYLDSFDDLAELVERRRRRASAAESRMKRERGEPDEPEALPADPLEQRRILRQRARAAGIDV